MDYVIIAIIGYIIGDISTSYIVGKIGKNVDVREHGSGNLGATNTFRVLGFKYGIVAFVGDVLKGVLASLIGMWIAGELGAVVGGCSAVLGHNWPVFLGFKGGKGIATSFGIIITLFPLVSIILFVVSVLVIAITRYVSLASISAAVLFPILIALFQYRWEYIVASIFLGLLALYRHKGNISRLLNGTENKIGMGPRVK